MLLLLFLHLIILSVNGQTDSFKIYIIPGRYDESDQAYFASNSIYQRYYWIGRAEITPKRDGVVNETSIRAYLNRAFPDKNASGVLSLDIEGEIMENLRKFSSSDPRFKKSEAKYIQMVRIVKKYRPNLKVGIYGLPFKYYSRDSYKESNDRKIYKILKEVDYISPSLYIGYPELERGFNFNKNYLELSVERSLKIAADLNKEVMPYVWHVVHPSNRRYGGKMMPAEEVEKYIQLIKDHTYQGKKVSGVLWWEEPTSSRYSFRKISPLSNAKSLSGEKSTNNNIIIEATKSLLK